MTNYPHTISSILKQLICFDFQHSFFSSKATKGIKHCIQNVSHAPITFGIADQGHIHLVSSFFSNICGIQRLFVQKDFMQLLRQYPTQSIHEYSTKLREDPAVKKTQYKYYCNNF